MFDFGQRLRELREQRHLSQEAMGKIVGRSKPVISSYENNLKEPPLEVLKNIAGFYNVSLDYLVGFEKKEMVSVEGLTESQKGIIHSLVFEFHDPKQAAVGFSERQQAIMSELMKEFSKKK
ncbi:HTH-type transcriptional regulator immR [uncultured Eubacterium sp.]|nr:HTH-type transcriptional regulator immR [uncultured Eubacterium sp.]